MAKNLTQEDLSLIKESDKKKKAKMKEINVANVFSKGVLVSLRSRLWGATGKLEQDQYSVIDETIGRQNVHASINLLKDTSLIKSMKQVRSSAQRLIKNNSLPFPEVGLYFIPKNRIEHVTENLEKYRTEYLEYGQELIKKLKDLEVEFKNDHPKLYNPARYPSEEYLNSIICFEYVLRIFSAPDQDLGVISYDMYKREVEKFKADISKMKDNTVAIICKEIRKRIDQLADQCDTGKVNQATLNSFQTIMDRFQNVWSGFVDEKEVLKIMKDLDLYLDGTDSKMLKYDSNFRQMVGAKAKDIVKVLENKGFKRSIDI